VVGMVLRAVIPPHHHHHHEEVQVMILQLKRSCYLPAITCPGEDGTLYCDSTNYSTGEVLTPGPRVDDVNYNPVSQSNPCFTTTPPPAPPTEVTSPLPTLPPPPPPLQ